MINVEKIVDDWYQPIENKISTNPELKPYIKIIGTFKQMMFELLQEYDQELEEYLKHHFEEKK